MSTFVASPTMVEFMQSPAFVRVLGGPVGGGKSVCCTHTLLHWSTQQKPNAQGVRKTRWLIVRNTADQLRSTTMKTFFDWVPPGIAGEWKATEKTFYLKSLMPDGTRVEAEFLFIPLDTPDDVRKALSLEATGLWGNECRELHPDVVDALMTRIDRYPSPKDGGATRAGAIFDTNMPDVDTWWHDKMENPLPNWSIHIQPPAILDLDEYITLYGEDPDQEPVRDGSDHAWYMNPGADNYQHLSRAYYPNILPGKSEDFVNVYLRCRYGRSLSGLPVYDKTFRPDFHVAEAALLPIRSASYPIIVGLDFGRTPAAVFKQMDPRGRVLTLSELTSTNMGIETFLREKMKPHIYERYQGCSFIVAPDPAGFFKQQIGEVSPVDVVKAAGFKVDKPSTNSPELRIQGVERLLGRQVDGKAGYLVDPGCTVLIKGFRYGYRYKLNKGGQQSDSPDKNEFSHVHDANQYGDLVVDKGLTGGQLQTQARKVEKVKYAWG